MKNMTSNNYSIFNSTNSERSFSKNTRSYNGVIIIIGILLNILGRNLTHSISTPFWLDSIGTLYIACMIGGIPGAIVGGLSSVVFALTDIYAWPYALVGIFAGLITGKKYPKDTFDSFKIVFTSVLVAFASVFICIPLNMILYGGYTGNVCGDAFFDMLRKSGYPAYMCAILSEGFIDFPDKLLSMLIVTGLIKITARPLQKLNKTEVVVESDAVNKDNSNGVGGDSNEE